jgi:hypothetical protein
MAEEFLRHAAGRPTYEVREQRRGATALEPAHRFESGDYAMAVEYALEFLERRDPGREGLVTSLEIVRVDGASREVVWTYPHGGPEETPRDLVGRWGFDVTRGWHGPAATLPRPPSLRRTGPLRRV